MHRGRSATVLADPGEYDTDEYAEAKDFSGVWC
jgi:hypothetical protein